MKYTIAIASILLLSSFTICPKMVYKDGKTWWEMYLYPNCTDTTTYIMVEYYTLEAHKERKVYEKDWVTVQPHVTIDERAMIANDVFYSSYYDAKGSVYTEDNDYKGKWIGSSRSNSHPQERSVRVSDSTSLTISYFANGTISDCTLQHHKKEVKQQMVWDSTYSYIWQGNTIEYTEPIEDTTLQIDGPFNNTIIVKHSYDKRIGRWEKHDMQGRLLDTMNYK